MKEAYLYNKSGDYVECRTCNHFCRIAPYKRGICGVRENQKSKLYLLVYGRLIAENIDPIEKKPFYHFLPKTKALSIATLGCNFKCDWCQNWDISQSVKKDMNRDEILNKIGIEVDPERVVTDALKNNCPSIAYTYTEPTIFLEYALDTMKLARKKRLKNIWVSNGYMSHETIELIAPYLDAINIDLKGFSQENYLKYSGAKLSPVLHNIKTIYKKGIHLEVTTLIIPGVNDDKKQLNDIAKFIASISKDIPWHISRAFGAYKMPDIEPTPMKTLEMAAQLGKDAGLEYIHLGNI